MSEQVKDVHEVISMTETRFKSVAPAAINYEAEKGFAMQVLTNNGYLMKVAQENPGSLAQAITNVAAIGLSLNPAEKQAYLIPRSVKEGNNWVSKVFLEPSYMGLCKLATDSGSIEWVQAKCVYQSDTFTDNGPGERPTHSYNAFSTERGAFVGVYCIAKTHTGDYLTTVMPAEKVFDIMERSETIKKYRKNNNSGFGGPWLTDFEQMSMKAVVREGFKMWPRSDERRMAQAVHLSNENEGFEPIVTSPEIRDFTAEQKAYYDQLIENGQAMEMYVLLETLEGGVRTNLYHSFERGTKGKYQQIVDALYARGQSTFTDCADAINTGAQANDDTAVMEVYEDLSHDTFELMRGRVSDAAIAIIDENTQ